MLSDPLSSVEVRVLGSLIEKELATPDHYPLSLNSLVSACNQASNREPVTAYDDTLVSGAIDVLRRASLVRSFQGSGERVAKYQHLLADSGDLSRAERAVLGVLALRGPQTLAEIRTRAGRLAGAGDAGTIESALEALMGREPSPLVTRLARRPGQKEARYAHLLSGDVSADVFDDAEDIASPPADDRLAAVETMLGEMRTEITELRAQLDAFRRQFE